MSIEKSLNYKLNRGAILLNYIVGNKCFCLPVEQ